jgi:hypothetical protein
MFSPLRRDRVIPLLGCLLMACDPSVGPPGGLPDIDPTISQKLPTHKLLDLDCEPLMTFEEGNQGWYLESVTGARLWMSSVRAR